MIMYYSSCWSLPEDSESTFSHLDSATVGKVLSEPSSTGSDTQKQAQKGNRGILNKNQWYNKGNRNIVYFCSDEEVGHQ